MTHLTEEELILRYYGESDGEDEGRVEEHLARCADCQMASAQLTGVLQLVETTPMTEPGPGFERDVWARLEPQLDASGGGRRGWFTVPQWALAAGLAALLAVAFAAGRFSGGAAPTPDPALPAAGSSARVLQAAVSDHLDRSQVMLLELVNSDSSLPAVLDGEQSRAADLVSANRLFRQSAEQSGDTAIADLLDDLERVLLEISNTTADGTSIERAELKSRIETEDLLFRVRVIASEMRQRTDRGPDQYVAQRPPTS